MTGWRAGALATASLAVMHLALGWLAGSGLTPSMNLALFATNLYALYCGAGLARERTGYRLSAFVAGYFILFVLVMVLLDRKPLFIILVVLYASVFRSGFMLGLYSIFVLSFVVLQPYAFESFVPLTFIFVVIWRARFSSNFHRACLGLGLGALALVLFPLMHLAVQDSAQTLWKTLTRPDVQQAVGLSVASSTLATVIIALWGIPLAYAMARTEFAGKRVVESLIDLPILVPQSVVGIGLLVLLGGNSPLGAALADNLGLQITGRFAGIVIAQVFVGAPFLVKTAIAAFEAVPLSLEMASRTLGASAHVTFWRVALPLASRGVGIGLILAWARAISEMGSILLVAASPVTAPILVQTEFLRAGAAESRPIAVLLLMICLWMFVLLQAGQSIMPFGMQRRERSAM